MATNQQNINIGTADNANDGDVLRAAFRKVRKMFAEIYGDTDAENLTDTEVVPSTNFDTHITEKIQDTVSGMFSNGTQTNVIVTYDDADGSIDLNVAADITDVNAGDGLTGVNEDGGAATLNVVGGDGITVNADEVEVAVDDSTIELSASDGTGVIRIKDDAVTHDKLEGRYTAVTSITTLTGTVSFDASASSVFKLSGDLTGAYTIDLTGYKKGQMISIFPLKGQTVNLDAQGTSTNTFYKLAGADYDNTVTSLLQIECVDDSATDPVFFYSVATYASDSSI